MSERIMSFRDLKVYQAAFELQQRVFKVTKSFPKEEMYALTDQFWDCFEETDEEIGSFS